MSTLLANFDRVKAIKGWMKTPGQGLEALWKKIIALMLLLWRPATLCLCDSIFTALSGYLGLALKQETLILSPTWMRTYLTALIPLVAMRLGVLTACGVYRIVARHTGVRDIAVIGFSTLVSSFLFGLYVALNAKALPMLDAVGFNGAANAQSMTVYLAIGVAALAGGVLWSRR